MTDVKPGQIWADNDPRSAGRTLRVERIEDGKAVCTILTNITVTQVQLERGVKGLRDMRGKTTRISLARFRPTASGYRKIRDTQYGIRYEATGPVFAFPSQAEAQQEQRERARSGLSWGVLVVHEYEPGTASSTEWREVEG